MAYLYNLYCFSNLLGQKLQVYWSVYMKLDHHSNLHELNKFASFFCRVYGYIYDSFEQFFLFVCYIIWTVLTLSCSTCNYSSSCRNKFYWVIFRIYLFESILALDFNNTSECQMVLLVSTRLQMVPIIRLSFHSLNLSKTLPIKMSAR